MWRLFAVLVISASVLACGGGVTGGPSADPVAAVTNVVNALKAKSLQLLPSMYCAGHSTPFDSLGSVAALVPGLTVDAYVAPVTFNVTNFTATLYNQTGNEANVSVTGTLDFTVDAARARDLVRTVFQAQGVATDEASLNSGVVDYQSNWSGSHPISRVGSVHTVKEANGWVVCDALLDS